MYELKQWRNRNSEFKGRRKLINVDTKEEMTVDTERVEGTLYDEGNAFDSDNMNDLERRIFRGFEKTQTVKETATITNTGWTSTSGYYQKDTGINVPAGFDRTSIDLYIPASSLNNLESWVCVESVGSDVFIRSKFTPLGSLSITLIFKREAENV